MDELLAYLRPDPERMRANLALSGELIATENATLALAPSMGRESAHHVVREAAARCTKKGSDPFSGKAPAIIPPDRGKGI